MKPVPRSYGVSGELKPVKPNSYGVVNMVSVLVSVADSYATKPLPLKRFGMEARVGIEPSEFLCSQDWAKDKTSKYKGNHQKV